MNCPFNLVMPADPWRGPELTEKGCKISMNCPFNLVMPAGPWGVAEFTEENCKNLYELSL